MSKIPINYYIKDDYITNTETLTIDEDSGQKYWNANRIKSSYLYQFPVYSYLLDIVKTNNIKTIMDIGCGVASKLAYVHKKLPTLDFIGIDQLNAIDYCNNTYDFGTWITDNFERPSGVLKTVNTPDLIVCSDVIEHLKEPNILLQYIKDVSSPETLIVLSTPDRDRLRGTECNHCPNKHHIREWNSTELSEYINSQGFKIIDHFHQPPIKISLNRLFYSEVLIRFLKSQPIKYNQVLLLSKQ